MPLLAASMSRFGNRQHGRAQAGTKIGRHDDLCLDYEDSGGTRWLTDRRFYSEVVGRLGLVRRSYSVGFVPPPPRLRDASRDGGAAFVQPPACGATDTHRVEYAFEHAEYGVEPAIALVSCSEPEGRHEDPSGILCP